MFEVRDDLGQVLATEPTFDRAETAMDDLCAKVHAQAVANAEGTADTWHHFEIVDTGTGERAMFRDYNPDPSRPYAALDEQEET